MHAFKRLYTFRMNMVDHGVLSLILYFILQAVESSHVNELGDQTALTSQSSTVVLMLMIVLSNMLAETQYGLTSFNPFQTQMIEWKRLLS